MTKLKVFTPSSIATIYNIVQQSIYEKRKNLSLIIKSQLSLTVLIMLAILYAITQTLAILVVGKLITTPFGAISAGSIVAPFWFLFNDMIAELYGYQISRIVFFCAMTTELFFSLVAVCILALPSPSDWTGTAGYSLVMGHLPFIYFAQLLAITFGWYVNTKFLLRWKFLLGGRLFWLRSAGSSAIGEIIFSAIAASIIMSGLVSSWKVNSTYLLVMHLVFWSALLKIIFTTIFTLPVSLILSILKRFGIEDDSNFAMNPFRMNNIQQ
jgi:hypothetical protein